MILALLAVILDKVALFVADPLHGDLHPLKKSPLW